MGRRIAIFTNSVFTIGGEQRVVVKIANELSKRHDVTLYTMDPSFKEKKACYEISDKVCVGFYHPYRLDFVSFVLRVATHMIPWLVYDKCPWMLKRAYYCDKYADLLYKHIRNDFDTVIVTAWQLSIILGMTVKKYKISCRTIGWQHSAYDAYFERKHLYLYKHTDDFVENAGHLSKIVVLNEVDSNKYYNNLGIKCEVIYNPKSFTSEKKSDVKNRRFIASGRITPPKRFDRLIEAFNIYSKMESEWELVILGDGPLRGRVERLIKKYNLGARVHMYGFTRDVITPMLKSSIFLLTSDYEGFPMCITEAYELGLPVISFDIPAMEPLSRNGEAIIVDAFDIKKYAKEMYSLAADYGKRLEMQKNAISMAESLRIEVICSKWKRIIESSDCPAKRW